MDILKYRCDAENLKVALKCRYLHINPYGFMKGKGNYTAREIVSFVRRGDFSRLPANLAAAAQTALAAINDSESARTCDLMIERAALLDAICESELMARLNPQEDIPSYYIAK